MPLSADHFGVLAALALLTGCGGGRGLDAAPRIAPPDDRLLQGREQDGGPQYDQRASAPAPLPPRDSYPTTPDPLPPGVPAGDGPRGTSQATPGERRYDTVGYASWYGSELGNGRTASGQPFNPRAITAAHPNLPMGSFLEVTSLDTGKTILVIVTDRGPSSPDRLIDLSRGAAELLGIDRAGIAAVRVRIVDPPGPDQTALREGRSASPRIDAPPVLLSALRKRLPPRRGVPPPAPPAGRASAPPPVRAPARAGASYAQPGYAAPGYAAPGYAAPAAPRAGAAAGGLYVQIIAVSSRERALSLAQGLGGSVQQAGGIYRVRLGPFADRDAALRARDDAARRGYGDARVTEE